MTVLFRHASRASKGARPYQEDTAAIWPDLLASGAVGAAVGQTDAVPLVLAVLADGMGGHVGGALASRMVCEALLDSLIDKPSTVVLTGNAANPMALKPEARSTTALIQRLAAGLEAANRAVAKKVDEKPGLNGMGATAVAIHLEHGRLLWISVGDSPLYLYRAGEIVQVNQDHSLAPEIDKLAESGQISWDEAKSDARRHYLRSAVTGTQIELIDVPEQPLALEVGDILVLASDGIQTLDKEKIADDISAIERLPVVAGPSRADAIAERLILAVDGARQPHQDNTTLIVIEVVAA